MKLGTCCCKALKHGQAICPVCNQRLLKIYQTEQLAIKFKEKQK